MSASSACQNCHLCYPRGKMQSKQCQLRRSISKSPTLTEKVQVRNSSSVLRAVHLQVHVQFRTSQKEVRFEYSSSKVWGLALGKWYSYKFKKSAQLDEKSSFPRVFYRLGWVPRGIWNKTACVRPTWYIWLATTEVSLCCAYCSHAEKISSNANNI